MASYIDILTDEDRLYWILKRESQRNQYGSTLYFLAHEVGISEPKAKSILAGAAWVKLQYGRYYFVEDDTETLEYDFNHPASMAFTKPLSLIYFEETISTAETWRDLYVDFLKTLYEDYPNRLNDIAGVLEGKESVPLIATNKYIHLMQTPVEFETGLFVELNESTTAITRNIKRFLDICNVDYENVVITYKHKDAEIENTARKADEQITPQRIDMTIGQSFQVKHMLSERHYIRDDKENFYQWLINNQKLAKSTCTGYVSAVKAAEDYAKRRIANKCALFTNNKDILSFTAAQLFENKEFQKQNRYQHDRYFAAIRKYLEYVGIEEVQEEPSDKGNALEGSGSSVQSTNNEACNEVEALLKDDDFRVLRESLNHEHITTIDDLKTLKLWPFMNRHDLYSIGQRQTIFSKVNALLYPAVDLDDSCAYVLNVGKKAYKGTTPSEAFRSFCNEMVQQYPLQFRMLVGSRLSYGGNIPIRRDRVEPNCLQVGNLAAFIGSNLTLEEVVNYSKWICNRCGEKPEIVTISEPQKTESEIKQEQHTGGTEIPSTVSSDADDNKQPAQSKEQLAIINEIEKFVLKADLNGVSYDDVKNEMRITMVATKQLVWHAKHIVDIKGRLYHEDSFIDWDDGANQLEGIIDKLMQKNNGYVSSSQLYEYSRVDMNMFLNDNDLNDERSVFDMAQHLFEKVKYHGKEFTFTGKQHISQVNQNVTSNLDVIKKYAADQGGVFSFDSLTEYLQGIGIGIGNLRMQMKITIEPIFFYYSEGILMYADSMHIDTEWKSAVRTALTSLFSDVGDYIVLRELPTQWLESLPTLPGRMPWTPLLIQSILHCFSKELGAKTIPAMTGQSIETLHAMLVNNNSPIQGFGDVVVSYLIDNEVKQRTFEAEELRRLLVYANILQGNELIWNMPKALKNDERFAWDASGEHVIVEV